MPDANELIVSLEAFPDTVGTSLLVSGDPRAPIKLWKANTSTIRVMVKRGRNGLYGLGGIESVTLRGRVDLNEDSALLFSKTLAASDEKFNAEATLPGFNEGDEQHFLFSITAAELNVPIANGISRPLWLSVKAILSTGGSRTLGFGKALLLNDAAEADDPEEGVGVALTIDEGDARYLQQGEEGIMHGDLGGLSADDHPQYVKRTETIDSPDFGIDGGLL